MAKKTKSKNIKCGIRYSDAQKEQGLRLASEIGITSAAAKIGCTAYTLYQWQKKQTTLKTLPTKKAATRKMALVVTGFACPHCGGAVEVNQ